MPAAALREEGPGNLAAPPRPEPVLARPRPAETYEPDEDHDEQPEPRRQGLLDRVLSVRGWPIAAVMAIQVALSLRLIWSNTAFLDEGTYLSVGHLDLAHYFHHALMPVDFATYLSGSPLVYPPLAAIADDIGGLAAARLLSLGFILLATFLLHGVCRRLMSSRPAAFFAAALFAGIAPAQFLSALATFDAMALCLLAVATWLGVRAAEVDQPGVRYALLCAGGLAIMVADAAKYAATLFDPIVIAVVALACWRAQGRKAGLDACGAMALAAAVPLVVGYDLAGPSLAEGIYQTTLARADGTDSVSSVITLSAQTTAVVAALALLGAVLLTVRRSPRLTLALAWILVAAEFLAPAEQARIHSLVSLFKHVGYGAWFACVIAGYLLADGVSEAGTWLAERRGRVPRGAAAPVGRPTWALAVSLAAVLVAGSVGVDLVDKQYQSWPNSKAMLTALDRYVRPGGVYLAEESDVIAYYLRKKIPYQNIKGTVLFYYVEPKTGKVLINAPAWNLAVKQRYFTAVVLRFGSTYAVDELVVQDMLADKDYRLAADIPFDTSIGSGAYQIWVPIPPRHLRDHKTRHKVSHH